MANFDLETEFRRKQLQKMKNISIIILFRKNRLLAVEVRGLSPVVFNAPVSALEGENG